MWPPPGPYRVAGEEEEGNEVFGIAQTVSGGEGREEDGVLVDAMAAQAAEAVAAEEEEVLGINDLALREEEGEGVVQRSCIPWPPEPLLREEEDASENAAEEGRYDCQLNCFS